MIGRRHLLREFRAFGGRHFDGSLSKDRATNSGNESGGDSHYIAHLWVRFFAVASAAVRWLRHWFATSVSSRSFGLGSVSSDWIETRIVRKFWTINFFNVK
jgi:hypothetical protein